MPRQTKDLMNHAIGNVTDLYCDDEVCEVWSIGHLAVVAGSFECDHK